jgi:hypothetical protein
LRNLDNVAKDIPFNFEDYGKEYEEDLIRDAEDMGKYMTKSELHKEIEEKLRVNNP